jgi:anti-sigma factor RsiW
MHELVIDSLEELVNGYEPGAAVKAHLANCEVCRSEVAAMVDQHKLFQAFNKPAEIEPHPGFYARVMNRIESQARPSIWSLFSESLFAKRLAYASLTVFVLLSTFLVSSSSQADVTASVPEAILADESSGTAYSSDVERDRQNILVTLATYEE